jgi:hypothetical protein
MRDSSSRSLPRGTSSSKPSCLRKLLRRYTATRIASPQSSQLRAGFLFLGFCLAGKGRSWTHPLSLMAISRHDMPVARWSPRARTAKREVSSRGRPLVRPVERPTRRTAASLSLADIFPSLRASSTLCNWSASESGFGGGYNQLRISSASSVASFSNVLVIGAEIILQRLQATPEFALDVVEPTIVKLY